MYTFEYVNISLIKINTLLYVKLARDQKYRVEKDFPFVHSYKEDSRVHRFTLEQMKVITNHLLVTPFFYSGYVKILRCHGG